MYIIVLNGRDVTYSPLATIVAENTTNSRNSAVIKQYLQKFKHLIQVYNQRLAKDLNSFPEIFLYNTFQFDEKNIEQINSHGLFYSMHGKSYKMTNDVSPCYSNLQGDYQGIAGSVCNNPYDYYFYDRIHNTTYVNYLLARDVYQEFSKNAKAQ